MENPKMTDVYRPLPEEFTGPVCVDCRHCRVLREKPHGFEEIHYVCVGFEGELLKPAYQNPITGMVHKAQIKTVYCYEHNDKGQCDRFAPHLPTLVVKQGFFALAIRAIRTVLGKCHFWPFI